MDFPLQQMLIEQTVKNPKNCSVIIISNNSSEFYWLKELKINMFIECKQFLFNCCKIGVFYQILLFCFSQILSLIPETFLFICITSELIILSYYKLTIKHLERVVSFYNFAYTTN